MSPDPRNTQRYYRKLIVKYLVVSPVFDQIQKSKFKFKISINHVLFSQSYAKLQIVIKSTELYKKFGSFPDFFERVSLYVAQNRGSQLPKRQNFGNCHHALFLSPELVLMNLDFISNIYEHQIFFFDISHQSGVEFKVSLGYTRLCLKIKPKANK